MKHTRNAFLIFIIFLLEATPAYPSAIMAYAIDNRANFGTWTDLYKIDMNTGGDTYIGSAKYSGAGYSFFEVSNNNTAYAITNPANSGTYTSTYKIDLSTGVTTYIGQGSNKGVGFDLVKLYTAPVPEPDTYALMVLGLGLVGWLSRHRKLQSA